MNDRAAVLIQEFFEQHGIYEFSYTTERDMLQYVGWESQVAMASQPRTVSLTLLESTLLSLAEMSHNYHLELQARRHPAVARAWEHYQLTLNLARQYE
jgi:hypothetical protein